MTRSGLPDDSHVLERPSAAEPPGPDDLVSLLRAHASAHPARGAILAPGRDPLTYGNLLDQVARGAAVVSRIVRDRGARVAVGVPNGPEMAVACFAVAACRPCVPLNPAEPAAELRNRLLGARVEAVVMEAADRGPLRSAALGLGLPILEVAADPFGAAGAITLRGGADATGASVEGPADAIRYAGPEDVAFVFQTSGTTARPKQVPLGHRNVVALARIIAGLYPLGPDDRCLSVMPLFHCHALIHATLASLAAGSSVVCAPRFDPIDFFRWIAEFRPTWYTAVPTVHQAVIANAENYRRLAPDHHFRFVLSGSAALAPATLARLEAVTGAPVLESYGLTETSTILTSNPMPPALRKPGSVGVPVAGRIAIVDVAGRILPPGESGEIIARGPGVMRGYDGGDEANRAAFVDGWLRTGDEGRFDADGYLYITGRIKEIVNRGGTAISPREIDDALHEIPGVEQGAAFGFPHPSMGEDLAAAVVCAPGVKVDAVTIRTALATRLPAHKVPSRILFTTELPRTASGKLQRTRLAELLLGEAPARDEGRELTPSERLIARVWQDELGVEHLLPSDNFFDLGGDSLRGMRVIAQIERRSGVRLAPQALVLQTLQQLGGDLDRLLGSRAEAPSGWLARWTRRIRGR